MDVDDEAADGIYTVCTICGAVVAAVTTHDAWHEATGRGA